MITREQKYFRAGWMAKTQGTSGEYGTLYKSSDGRWYIFSSNPNMDGSKPEDDWERVRGENHYSFWLCDGDKDDAEYSVDLNYAIDGSFKMEPIKPTFNPRIGDILHIMTKEDLMKFNSRNELAAGGNYTGYHFEVTSLSGDAVYGNVFNKSGELVLSGWGIIFTDFYEYHGINPSPYSTPYIKLTRDFDGMEYRKLETKSLVSGHSIIDGSCSMAFGSAHSGAYSTGAYTTKASVASGYSCVRESRPVSDSVLSSLSKSSDGYVSPDSIKHPTVRCTLPHTSDWQIAGDSVPRKKATDMLLILGL